MIRSMYAGEPCRVCGSLLTREDIEGGAVFAGYSLCNKSRAAHRECWERGEPKESWAFPLDDLTKNRGGS